jgi:hypothetical protein
VSVDGVQQAVEEESEHNSDSNKKMRKTSVHGSADLAGAAEQPCHT